MAHAEFLAVILFCPFPPLPSAETATIAPSLRALFVFLLSVYKVHSLAGGRRQRRQKKNPGILPLLFQTPDIHSGFKSTGLLESIFGK